MTDRQAVEIRSILHKGLARGLIFSECLAELQSIFGTECPSHETVLRWYEAITLDNVELVKKLIEEDPKVTRQQIQARLNIGGPVVRSIVRDRLGLRKIGNRWVIRKTVEENGGDKNADVSNGISVKLENDFQIKSEVEDNDLSETKEEFDDDNNIAMHNDAEIKCEEATLDVTTPDVYENIVVKKEIVDENLEHDSYDLKYLCMGHSIKEEPIDIFDERVEFDTQIEQEKDEFSERIESKDELRKRLKKKSSNTDVQTAIILTSGNRYACKHCNKSYKHACHAYRHVSQSCQITKVRFKCKKCGRNFATKHSLKRHEFFLHANVEKRKENLPRRKNTEGNFICHKCNKRYPDKYSLRRHENLECGKEPRFACAHCDYRTLQKSNLAKHLERIHPESPTGNFICHKCNRRYRDKYNLRRHVDHECGQKPKFACAHCDYRSLQKINLVRHLERTHAESAMTRFSCPKCDRSYKNEYTLKRHLQLECGKEKAFACDSCSFRTKRKSSLATHVQNQHLNKKKRSRNNQAKKFL